MALASKPPVRQRPVRRIWRTPGSKFSWLFLSLALIIVVGIALIYRSAIATQPYAGPYSDPLRLFGIVAFGLFVLVFAYTLRRRFVRGLPGKVQDWLWLHTWFGLASIVIACMHENFQNITHDFSFLRERFTEAEYGTTALYSLLLLVLTGILGRLLDVWQARVITHEANTNGVGIMRSVQDRLFELALTVERLSAGKSAQFKQYCEQALAGPDTLPAFLPVLAPSELDDFQRVHTLLMERVRLARSLRRQQRAHFVIRTWRSIHIPLACFAALVILYHSGSELWKMLILHQ